MMPGSNIYNTGLVKLLIVLGVFLVINGCGAGSGQGLDENGNLIELQINNDTGGGDGGDTGDGGDGGGALSGNPNATLAWVQSNVFGGVCSQCHTGAGAPFVNWSSESNTCSNVGRTSGEINTLKEIESGNPDGSYVIWKLNGQGPNGEAIAAGTEQMPAGGNPPLNAETIQNISDWISDGTPGCTASKSPEPVYTQGSWAEVWNESLRACTLCHSIVASSPACSTDFECPPNGLVLSEDNYFGVVDGNTVVPSDLSNSILWERVNTLSHESRIPSGYPALTQTQIDIIQHWIENGAQYCPEDQVCQ